MVLPLPDNPVTLLLVSGEASDRASLAGILVPTHWKLRVCSNCRKAMDLLRDDCVPVVICNREAAGGSWRSIIAGLAELPAPPSLIVSSRVADERLWAEVLNLGGYDVLLTPFDRAEVLRVCFQAWKSWQREHESVAVRAAR